MDNVRREFTAGDLRKIAGFSSRQLNDWDSKDVLPPSPRSQDGWRKYTKRDVFIMMVLAEIRKSFNVPLPKLKFVSDFMSQEGADHYRAAVTQIGELGVPVVLFTDFETTFIVEPITELISELGHDLIGGDTPGNYALIKLNPIVNRLLACLEEPVQLREHGLGYRILHAGRDVHAAQDLATAERRVLECLRVDEFERVEVTKKNGALNRLSATQIVDVPDAGFPRGSTKAKDGRAQLHGTWLAKLLAERPYQRLSAVVQDERVTKVTREVSIKL